MTKFKNSEIMKDILYITYNSPERFIFVYKIYTVGNHRKDKWFDDFYEHIFVMLNITFRNVF